MLRTERGLQKHTHTHTHTSDISMCTHETFRGRGLFRARTDVMSAYCPCERTSTQAAPLPLDISRPRAVPCPNGCNVGLLSVREELYPSSAASPRHFAAEGCSVPERMLCYVGLLSVRGELYSYYHSVTIIKQRRFPYDYFQ